MSIHESSSSVSLSETSSSLPRQTRPQNSNSPIVVQTSQVPPWARLLAAPACCVALGILLSPKFLVLAVIYGITSIRPLYGCYKSYNSSYRNSSSATSSKLDLNKQLNNKDNNKDNDDPNVRQQLDAALALHRSLTLQFAMLAVCLWLYEHSRLLCMPKNNINDATVDDDTTNNKLVVHQAFDMARRLVRWEHALHLAIEPSLQKWFLGTWIIAVANTYYAILHFVAPVGVMARLIVFQKDPRYEYRLGFFIMLFFALLLFTFVPTMPPRLMPSYHAEYIETQQVVITQEDATILEPYWQIVDTMKQGETLYDKMHKEGGNPYAAMPSMHTGWALWSCLTWIGTLDSSSTNESSRRYQTGLAVAHVVFMIFVILVTGNHFWLDSAAGAVCVLLGRVLARRVVQGLRHCREGNGVLAQWLRRLQLLVVNNNNSWLIGLTATDADKKLRQYDTAEDEDEEEELTQALTLSSGNLSRSSSSVVVVAEV